jgi:fructose-specific phosphotransferase system IIC component
MFAGLVIGSIALTSLTNTFCHVHTPFELSIYRTLAGALIGLILGLIAGFVVLGLTRIVRAKPRD